MHTSKQISYRNIHKLDQNAFLSIYNNSNTFDTSRNIIDIANKYLILTFDSLCPLKHRNIFNRGSSSVKKLIDSFIMSNHTEIISLPNFCLIYSSYYLSYASKIWSRSWSCLTFLKRYILNFISTALKEIVHHNTNLEKQ